MTPLKKNEQLALRFYHLFDGLRRAYGLYSLRNADVNTAKNDKVEGQGRTVQGDYISELWEKHLAGGEGLGVCPINDDSFCRFGAIDIDEFSIDHRALEQRVRKSKLPLLVCRTKSGGVHLYIFFKEWIPAETVYTTLLEWATFLGFFKVEVFPKQVKLASKADVGNWINMPYFEGERTVRYCINHNVAIMSPNDFCDLAESMQLTLEQLESVKLPETDHALREGPPCLVHLSQNGFPEGTRNNALFNLAIYCKLRWPDAWEEKLEELNREYMIPPLDSKEVQTAIKSIKKKDYNYRCKEPPVSACCNRTLCRTKKYGVSRGEDQDEPDVMIDSMTKITTDPPVYIVSVNGVRIEMQAEDVMSQARFNKLCFIALNFWPNTIKAPAWKGLIKKLMITINILDAPMDASPSGQFLRHLEQFCTGRVQAKMREELLSGKPWTDPKSKRTYFRSMDLLRFLQDKGFRDLKPADIWRVLQKRDVEHKQLSVNNSCVQCWTVPQFESTPAVSPDDDPLM
tara:strand:+ start:6882 stop:8423 length:1542 start_codon:yes stop_codon:yes gene_type:complete